MEKMKKSYIINIPKTQKPKNPKIAKFCTLKNPPKTPKTQKPKNPAWPTLFIILSTVIYLLINGLQILKF